MGQWIASANCKTCKALYKDYKEEGYEIDPPCGKCFPGIHPYNEVTYMVYVHCSDQVILGMEGAVSINILAMDLVIDRLVSMDEIDIEDYYRLNLYSSVNQLFSVVKKTAKEIAKRKQVKNKK